VNRVFLNGTDRQRALFDDALEQAIFPWDRIPHDVYVRWEADPEREYHNEAAVTTVSYKRVDACERPIHAAIDFRADLDSAFTERFYRETVVHELGHVLASMMHTSQIDRIVACYRDATRADWSPEVEDPTAGTNWTERVEEAFCESFKDVYLPRAYRQFNQRTKWVLRRDRYDEWLGVIDELCPCDRIIIV